MGDKHSEKVLHDFKVVLKHQVILLRNASGADTVYFYWINRRREQFVLESRSTKHTNVMFQDRVSFEQHFLNQYKDIRAIENLDIGSSRQLDPSELTHYYNKVPVQQLTLVPLIHNGETIAVTVLEFSSEKSRSECESVIESYVESLDNLTETYLEITQLNRGEEQWEVYEQEIGELLEDVARKEPIVILMQLARKLKQYLSSGGVAVLLKEKKNWMSLTSFQTDEEVARILPGMRMEKGSIAADCIEQGEPVYISHLNGSPKRISSREPEHHGATLAVPLYINSGNQVVVLIYDKNPLVFKDSVRHKMINLVRLLAQRINISANERDLEDPFHMPESGLLRTSVWRSLLENWQDQRTRESIPMKVGKLTIKNLQQLRTRLRLEELKKVERALIERIQPFEMGLPGVVGSLKDYSYSVLLPENQDNAVEYYQSTLNDRLKEPIELDEGQEEVKLEVEVQFKRFHPENGYSIDNLLQTMKQEGS